MKQTWFRPPAFRQFSLDADADVAPSRPDGIAARLDGRPSDGSACKPRQPGARPLAESPAAGAGASESPAPEAATAESACNSPAPEAPARRAELRVMPSPPARRAPQGRARAVRRRVERVLDRYGYYMAVGVCAAMVFAGALLGASGYAPPAQPQPTQLTDDRVSDVAPEQPSAGDGLLSADVSANAALDGDAAPHSLSCWPLEGEVLTAHSLDALVYQPTLGAYATHSGIDIAGSAGQVVVACADGEVAQCWRESLLGNVVEVRGADGVVTRYANLASLELVSEGMSVSAGDALGAIGTSAMSESLLAPHLHFEVLIDGRSVPPEDWLPER